MSYSVEWAVPSRRDDLRALLYALILEVVLLVAIWVAHLLGFLQEEPPVREVAVLQLTEAPPAPQEAPPAPPPPKVQPVRQHEKITPVVSRQEPQPETPPAPVVPTDPTPFSEKKVQATPPPPAAPSNLQADELTEYAARVRGAVQAALQYPDAAREMQFVGRARVEFTLADGRPGRARIVATSGVNMLDRAAIRAVNSAEYPTPPASLKSKEKVFQIWVEFNLGQ